MNGSYIGDVYAGNLYPPEFPPREVEDAEDGHGGSPRGVWTQQRRTALPDRRTTPTTRRITSQG